jgi:hypothetical protein
VIAFSRAVRLERAWLALTDPAGEVDAIRRYSFVEAYAFLVRELSGQPRRVANDVIAGFDNDALLDALGVMPERSRGIVRCPAHEDRTPSLSWRRTTTGRLLVHCFAGCSWHEIRAALTA